eukprot:c26402_g1_i2 orf=146-496(-)
MNTNTNKQSSQEMYVTNFTQPHHIQGREALTLCPYKMIHTHNNSQPYEEYKVPCIECDMVSKSTQMAHKLNIRSPTINICHSHILCGSSPFSLSEYYHLKNLKRPCNIGSIHYSMR